MRKWVVPCPICKGEEPGGLCVRCEGDGWVELRQGDAREVLKLLRAHPLIEAADPESDEETNGCDAVDALVELRGMLDAALAGAPSTLARGV